MRQDREKFPLFFSPTGSGRAEEEVEEEVEEEAEEEVQVDVDLDGSGDAGRIGALSLRAGAAAAALLGVPTGKVPRTGIALVIVQRIAEMVESRREKTN